MTHTTTRGRRSGVKLGFSPDSWCNSSSLEKTQVIFTPDRVAARLIPTSSPWRYQTGRVCEVYTSFFLAGIPHFPLQNVPDNTPLHSSVFLYLLVFSGLADGVGLPALTSCVGT